jgi:ADP-ribosylation factor GTPase-activating protein 2/3
MKVGGNQPAKEYLKNLNFKDAKSKYESRQMQQYKEKLNRLVQEDIRLHPTELVIEGTGTVVEEVISKEDDFFAEWDSAPKPKQTITRKESHLIIPIVANEKTVGNPSFTKAQPKESFGIPQMGIKSNSIVHSDGWNDDSQIAPVPGGWNAEPAVTNGSLKPLPVSTEEPKRVSTNISPVPMQSFQSTTTPSFSNAGRKKMGAKKITKKIDFDEAARQAEVELERANAEKAMEALRLEKERSQPAKKAELVNPIFGASSHTPTTNRLDYKGDQKEEKKEGPKKFGFGFDPTSMEKQQTDAGVGHKSANKPPLPKNGGFGSVPSQTQVDPDLMKRFGNAKSISSDQYFGRNEPDPYVGVT